MKKYVVVMTSCNSNSFPKQWRCGIPDILLGHNYMDQTMGSLEKSGFFNSKVESELIICDSGSTDLSYLDKHKDKATIFPAPWPMCINENTHRALNIASQRTDEFVIFLQDDIIFCKNWIENVDRFVTKYYTPNYPMVTCYTPYIEVQTAFQEKKPTWNYRIDKFYGLQCVVLRKIDAANLGDTIIGKFVDRRPKFTKGADLAVKIWSARYHKHSKMFLACVPCLVEHIGNDSALASPKHTSFCFQGEDVDPRVAL